MDVVRTNIDQIGGTIDIKSVAGEGSSVTIKIPLTLAIVSALIVEAAGDRFAIPQLAVVELVRARANCEHRIERIKDTAGPAPAQQAAAADPSARSCSRSTTARPRDPENGFIVVTQVGSQTFGIVVDGVFHTEEIVVKPMSTKLRHIDMFSGNTILGDGAVIMIIDPNGIAKALGAAGSSAHDMADDERRAPHRTGEQTTSLLVFRAGSQPAQGGAARRSSPASKRSTADKIEFSNGRYMVQYREQLMPLVAMDERHHRQPRARSRSWCSPTTAARWASSSTRSSTSSRTGSTSRSAAPPRGILGSAVIKGQATEVIDVGHFLPMAFDDWFTRKEMKPSRHCAVGAAGRRLGVLPQHAGAGAQGRRLPRPHRADRAGGALAALRAQSFDVIVSDIEMPDMNGFEFAEAIRADSNLGAMPIIGLSALISPAAIERGRQAGFHDYVAKFDRHGLIAALKEQTAGAAGASELNRAAA